MRKRMFISVAMSLALGLAGYGQTVTPTTVSGKDLQGDAAKVEKAGGMQNLPHSLMTNVESEEALAPVSGVTLKAAEESGRKGMHKVEAVENIADSLVFYGVKHFDQGYDVAGGPYSFVRFHKAKTATTTVVNPSEPGLSCSFAANGKFYGITKDGDDVILNIYDGETFEKIGSKKVYEDGTALRQPAVFNHKTNKAYFLCWGEFSMETFRTMRPFVEIDMDTLEGRLVGLIDNYFIQSLFVDNDGNVYGVPYNTKELLKISTEDASVTSMGNLDIPFNRSAQTESSVTDPSTGTIYWCVPRQAGGGVAAFSYIYTVDPKTLHCEYVCDMPNSEHITGLHLKYAPFGAPAAAKDINLAGGKLNFTVPTTTYATGEALTGALTAVINADGVEKRVAVTAGENASVDLPLERGLHAINIRIENAEGLGAERILDIFLGSDAPSAVTDLNFTVAGNKANLTWNAPTTSVNGGAFDSSALKYDIVRYPDGTVVAKDYVPTIYNEVLPEAWGHYYYTVTPSAEGVQGETAKSNMNHAGSYWEAPHVEKFDHQEDYDMCTVYETEDHGHFYYMSSAGHPYYVGNGPYDAEFNPNGGQGVNDQFVSAPIKLKAGVQYEFTYDDIMYTSEKVNVTLNNSKNPADVNKSLNDFTLENDVRHVIFDVPQDGLYYICWNVCPVDWVSNFAIDNVGISVFSTDEGPAAVGNLKATAGAKGALKNTITFTAPTKTFVDGELSELTKIDIFRGSNLLKPVYTFEAPAVGAELSWVDENVEQGSYTYTVVPFNAAGQGKGATVTNWVGKDSPAVPQNIRYYQNANNMMTFTFDKVGEVGAHGGYVDPSEVVYLVARGDIYNSQYTWNAVNYETPDNTIEELNYVKSYPDWQQEFKPYFVRATNEVGFTSSDIMDIVVGEPYANPFEESFAGQTNASHPWTVLADTYYYSWGISAGSGTAVKPFDKDGGMIQFSRYGEDSDTQMLAGPRLSLAGLKNPELSFYMYHGFEADEEDLVFHIYANINDGEWEKIASFDYNNGADGWVRHAVALPATTTPDGHATANIQLRLNATSIDNSAAIFIDDIKLDDARESDVALASVSLDKRMAPGKKNNIRIAVANYGLKPVNDYSVVLHTTVDGKAQGDAVICTPADAKTINPAEAVEYKLSVTYGQEAAGKKYEYTAEVVADGDQFADNNTAAANVFVEGSILPTVDALAGADANGAVTLTWRAPATDEVQDAIVDGFDDYETFIIDNIGDWTTYDADGSVPVYFGGPEIPNNFVPKAWQVWAPVEAGFDIGKFDSLIPHSGRQYLTSWTASNGMNSTLPTDDWLISSEVVGGSAVKFYYRIPNAGSDEQVFHLLYSTTDQYPENFIELDSDSEPVGLDQWTELTYTLPRDAKYFAIQHTNEGQNTTVAFLDDIEYTPLYGSTSKVSFKGYNVYRDNVLVAENLATTSYTDSEGGNHKYNVTAVYAEGESVFSNDFFSGDAAGINGVVAGAANSDIYTVTGVKMNNMKNIPAGIYIVGGRKVIVK